MTALGLPESFGVAEIEAHERRRRRVGLVGTFGGWLSLVALFVGALTLGDEPIPVDGSLPPPQWVDTFDRDGPTELDGPSPGGIQWFRLGPAFEAADGVASVQLSDPPGQTAIALTETGSDATVNFAVQSAASGTGAVFRYTDLNNFWSLVAAPDFATWNVALVMDGTQVQTWPLGLVSLEPGTVVSVELIGSDIRIYIDNELLLTLNDTRLQEAPNAGLVAVAGSGGSFSRFSIIPTQVGQP